MRNLIPSSPPQKSHTITHTTFPSFCMHVFFNYPPNRPLFTHHRPPPIFSLHPRRTTVSVTTRIEKNGSFVSNTNQNQQPQQMLFPGGYKRSEIKIPNVVLQLNPNQVLDDWKVVLDVVDQEVSGIVEVVVLNGDGNGRVLYDAGCLLKSVIKDRAYLLISERVDIATAVNANGVVISNQVYMPLLQEIQSWIQNPTLKFFLIGRKVQTSNAAINNQEQIIDESSISAINQIKIPIFVFVDSINEDKLLNKMSYSLQSGASGLVVSLEGLKLLGNDSLNKIYRMHASDKKMEALNNGLEFDRSNRLPSEKGLVGFVNLVNRERELIQTERWLLLETIDVLQRALPLEFVNDVDEDSNDDYLIRIVELTTNK